MNLYPETLDPNETKDYAFDWSPKLGAGETLTALLAVEFVTAAGTTSPISSLASPITRVWLSGGTHGERALFAVRVSTSGGRTLEEAFAVDVVDSTLGPDAETTLAALTRQLAEAKAQRHKLALGAAVVEVWKDGRRVRYQESNIGSLDAYIADLGILIDAENAVVADSATLPRRRFIGVAF